MTAWDALRRAGGDAFAKWIAVLMFAVALILGLLGWQVEQRNDAIQEIREAAVRIEEAATHTEQVLVDVVEERQSPEAISRNREVQRALEDIAAVRRMLCTLPELVTDPACQ